MDWIIEVANIDSPYCNTNNCNYLKWMREKRRKHRCYKLFKQGPLFKITFPQHLPTMQTWCDIWCFHHFNGCLQTNTGKKTLELGFAKCKSYNYNLTKTDVITLMLFSELPSFCRPLCF